MWNDEDYYYVRKFVCNYPQNPGASIDAEQHSKLQEAKRSS